MGGFEFLVLCLLGAIWVWLFFIYKEIGDAKDILEEIAEHLGIEEEEKAEKP